MKNLLKIILITSLLAGCAVTPNHVKSTTASYDDSTPAQYNNKNSGFLYLIKGKGAVLTQDGKKYYDELAGIYGDQIVPAIQPGDGCTTFKDQYGNDLWFITSQHFVYFQMMSRWHQDNRPRKTLIDKVIKGK